MSFYNHPFEFSKHNVFRAAHLSYTMPKYWESYKQQYNRLSKYRKPTGTASGNALAIRHLQRQLNSQKPEIQQYQHSTTHSLTANAYVQRLTRVSYDLAGVADRSDRILGDTWVNKSLKIRLRCQDLANPYGLLRVMVVMPRKAGTTFSFPENTIPESNALTMLLDREYTWDPDAHTQRQLNFTVPLRNIQSTFIGAIPEKGEIQVYVCYRNLNTTTVMNLKQNIELSYSNK